MLLHELLLLLCPPSKVEVSLLGQSWALWSLALNWNIGISVGEEVLTGLCRAFLAGSRAGSVDVMILFASETKIFKSMVFLVSFEPLRTLHSLADWKHSSQALRAPVRVGKIKPCAIGKSRGQACVLREDRELYRGQLGRRQATFSLLFFYIEGRQSHCQVDVLNAKFSYGLCRFMQLCMF